VIPHNKSTLNFFFYGLKTWYGFSDSFCSNNKLIVHLKINPWKEMYTPSIPTFTIGNNKNYSNYAMGRGSHAREHALYQTHLDPRPFFFCNFFLLLALMCEFNWLYYELPNVFLSKPCIISKERKIFYLKLKERQYFTLWHVVRSLG
jgi:hypothetical protein